MICVILQVNREKDTATVLEPGEYVVRIGNSSRNTRVCGILKLETEMITEKHSHICKAPLRVTELEWKEEKELLHATGDCRQNWGRTCEIIIDDVEKFRAFRSNRGLFRKWIMSMARWRSILRKRLTGS